MGNATSIKSKVQEWLTEEFNGVQLTKQGGWSLRFGSARVFVDVEDVAPDDPQAPVMVRVTAPCVFKLTESAELYKYVALHTDDYRFGRLYITQVDDGTYTVGLSHQVLANYLDPEELKYAVGWVGGAADDVDDEIQKSFGGERYFEDD